MHNACKQWDDETLVFFHLSFGVFFLLPSSSSSFHSYLCVLTVFMYVCVRLCVRCECEHKNRGNKSYDGAKMLGVASKGRGKHRMVLKNERPKEKKLFSGDGKGIRG